MNQNDIDDFQKAGFEEVIMLGVTGDDITMLSTCETPEKTTAILDFATTQSLLDIFPHLRGQHVFN